MNLKLDPTLIVRGIYLSLRTESRYKSQISHRKLKFSISHDVVILASEPDAMLKSTQARCAADDP